jgi:hypothetical protein
MASPSITTVTRRTAGNTSSAIQQQITSGNFFNGTLPQAAGPVRADSPLQPGNALYKYAAATAGGLFFWNVNESLIVTQIIVDLGANANLSVFISNLLPTSIEDDSPTVIAGEEFLIGSLTASRIFTSNTVYTLLPYQAIRLVSTNSVAAQIASVSACLERTFIR